MNIINIYDDIEKNSCLDKIYINDTYLFYKINNIIQYNYINFNTWEVNILNIVNTVNENEIQYYFIIDTFFNDAFAHWVFESAIFIPAYIKLKDIYPNLKIYLKTQRKYKNLFIKYFNIDETNIVYDIEQNNISFFPLPITSLNNNTISDVYIEYFNIFNKYIKSFIEYNNTIINKILILPRGNKENYKGNDRVYNIDNIIDNLINKYEILNTDEIDDLNIQIKTINKYKNIILTDGSPFLVNGLFTKDRNIIVLGNIIVHQKEKYIKKKYIFDFICSNNKINFIPYYNGTFYDSIFLLNSVSKYLV